MLLYKVHVEDKLSESSYVYLCITLLTYDYNQATFKCPLPSDSAILRRKINMNRGGSLVRVYYSPSCLVHEDQKVIKKTQWSCRINLALCRLSKTLQRNEGGKLDAVNHTCQFVS